MRHREMAFLTTTDVVVGVDEGDDGVPADFKMCSLSHIRAVEPLSGVADRA